MATSTASVSVVEGPLPPELDERLAVLRQRFPRAIVDRYLDKLPVLGPGVLIAPGAAVVGEVVLGAEVSIWYGAVLRGDLAPVTVGERTNIQDGAVIHVGDSSPCRVGPDTVVGHRAVLHGCRIEEDCLIGMQATVLDDAVVGAGSVIGAGSVVTPGTVIPPRSLALGTPARVVRPLGEEDQARHRALAAKYVRLKENYLRDALRSG
jgi:carbonic anhydrase/acetyltransferase-like protein (isoleucine patch superfamily)